LNFDPTRIRCHPKVIEFYQNIDNPKKKTSSISSTISTESDISIEKVELKMFQAAVPKPNPPKQETLDLKPKHKPVNQPPADIRKYFSPLTY
jgi:hypothetical protein